ncbi:DUF3349 domain-containing protein [Rhodococcus sp. NPDC019627]|uniref:DUF3349 domain-containing protein n=1 Tax=unclassified Rhodococcus (in: high G+C Gram-positive bacteria) TaxID=192944 RepID=UPI0033FE8656
MPKYSLRSVLDWLRAGYPEGIPAKDHFALLAVLRRRLTDEEIEQVVALSIETAHEHPNRHVDYDSIRRLISEITHEEPSEEDVARVTANLTAGGWPVAGDTAGGWPVAGNTDEGAGDPKETRDAG